MCRSPVTTSTKRNPLATPAKAVEQSTIIVVSVTKSASKQTKESLLWTVMKSEKYGT